MRLKITIVVFFILINMSLFTWHGIDMGELGYYTSEGDLNVSHIATKSLLVFVASLVASGIIFFASKWQLFLCLPLAFMSGGMLLFSGLMSNSMGEYLGLDGFLYGVLTFMAGASAFLFCASILVLSGLIWARIHETRRAKYPTSP